MACTAGEPQHRLSPALLLIGLLLPRRGRHDNTVSACGDRVRMDFLRNDLLLWTTAASEVTALESPFKLIAPNLMVRPFVARALLDADVLVLGTGLHIRRFLEEPKHCLLYTSPSPRDRTRSRMPSSA